MNIFIPTCAQVNTTIFSSNSLLMSSVKPYFKVIKIDNIKDELEQKIDDEIDLNKYLNWKNNQENNKNILKNKKNICKNILTKKECLYKNCKYAHNIIEIKHNKCNKDSKCNLVYLNDNKYINTNTDKICIYFHNEETEYNYGRRTNLISPPKATDQEMQLEFDNYYNNIYNNPKRTKFCSKRKCDINTCNFAHNNDELYINKYNFNNKYNKIIIKNNKIINKNKNNICIFKHPLENKENCISRIYSN